MAYYLVSARPMVERLDALEARLTEQAFVGLEPLRYAQGRLFGRALTNSLEVARRLPDGTAVWEEEDYCQPPLAQERQAVLDHYFEALSVERVEEGSGWRRVAELPPLSPTLVNR